MSNKASDSLSNVLEKFYLDRMVGERSQKTIQFYKERLEAFVKQFPQLADRPFSEITVEHIEQHLLSKNGHAYAKSATYRSLRALWYFAVKRKIVPENIVVQVGAPKLPKDTTIPIVKREDLEALLQTCGRTFLGYRDRAIMLTLYDTGMRLSELTGMRFSNLDLENMTIKILGKGNKKRTLSFDESVRAAILHYIYDTKTRFETDVIWLTEEKNKGITNKGVEEMVARRSKAAGLSRIHPHMFRHACAVNLLRGDVRELNEDEELHGMDIDSVMKYLGQETLTVLQGYLKSLKSEHASKLHKKYSPAAKFFDS